MSIEQSDLRVRFAPSPTGALHIGGARTALYNWLAARHSGGEMLLRIEDTDLERSTEENKDQIFDALLWLGLDWDGEPVSQVGRADSHATALAKLLESGAAYRDSATADDVKAWKAEHGADRGYRGQPSPDGAGAIRLRVPDEGDTVVDDLIRGEVRFPSRSYDDFVIARGDGSVLYNFAVAVDDAEMGITEVIRGDDHLSNTPKQLLVFEALGIEPPRYAHVPLLHGPDGKKLSKRHGAASVQELRDAGYLPAAIRNYVAMLGWGPGDDENLLSTEELIKRFRPEDVGKSSAVFDEKKLRWMNGRYMREMTPDEYRTEVVEYFAVSDFDTEQELDFDPFDGPIPERFSFACEIVQEKAQTLAEVWPLIRFLFQPPVEDEKAWRKVMKGDAERVLNEVVSALSAIPAGEDGPNRDGFTTESVEAALEPLPERLELGAGKVFQPIRVSITGTTISPGIFESVAALGREETLARIEKARGRLAESTE